MANELYIFTTPEDTRVEVKPDGTGAYIAAPSNDTGRADEQKIQFPENLARQGAQLTVSAEGYETFQGRGLLQPQMICPTCGTVVASEAFFGFNDVHLKQISTTPPPDPGPGPSPSTPLEVINAVYSTGKYNLATKPGCGEFTEACAWELALTFGSMWGHILKDPGQNQYGTPPHAVDAIQAIYGEHTGAWDIIIDSVSSNARPAFNDAGNATPNKFTPAFPPESVSRIAESLAQLLGALRRVLR